MIQIQECIGNNVIPEEADQPLGTVVNNSY